ncbi:MAG: transposase [Okeania sp. SIO2C9]|uniref:RNA-guided endonuclease InsQ/TnpB family protein n=1 Tax=Okeania sp. SIO2C9 TaxID=2607791 RepID=UPI0013C18A2D|nr:transposase [Okeania sp. SIO2C9]NEQ73789.1 transposase [Okeania sp. SIO2C9]
MLNLTYEFKLKPTPQQAQEIERILEVCRRVWNYALAERKDWIRSRKSPINACSLFAEYIIPADQPYPNYARQSQALTKAKKDYPELKTVNAQALQQVLKTLETAFVDMKRKGMGFPRFKKARRMRSFVFPQMLKNCVQGIYLKLPQLGRIEYIKSREIPEGFRVKLARIIRKAGGYFVALCLECDVDVPDVPPHGYPIGIDLGLDKFLATSEGELIKRPRFFNSLHRQMKLLQRRLKKKQIGSNNWQKLSKIIARLHETIANTRKDFHFKLAHHLCDQAGMIFVEDLNFQAWAKGMWGKHTLDAGFGQFVTILQWVCWKRGVYFGKVNKDYTSQICPNCNAHTGKKKLSFRVHSCPECGYTIHRDVASALIVRNRGVSEVGRILDVKEVAWGGDLTGTRNGLVKSLRNRKKGGEAWIYPAS